MNDLKEIIIRGEHAQALVNSEAFQQAFGDIERNLFNAWSTSATRKERERAWTMVQAVRLLYNQLASYITQSEQLQIELGGNEPKEEEEEMNAVEENDYVH